jgi:hypothetical protein
VALEAEDASGGSNFVPFEVRTDSAAVGGNYIVVPDGTGPRQGSPPVRGQASYTIDVPESGEYAVWGRVRPKSNGNSFYFGVDSREPVYWDAPLSSDWIWAAVGPRDGPKETLTLSAGTHTLTVYWREDGMALDRLVVSDDLSYEPSGTGPDATDGGATATPNPTPTPTATSTPTSTPTDGDADWGEVAYGQYGYGGVV